MGSQEFVFTSNYYSQTIRKTSPLIEAAVLDIIVPGISGT